MQPPEVYYARSGDVAIAYQVVGDGPTDVVFSRGMAGDLVSSWEHPLLVRFIEGLASNGRLLMLDKRGTGLSDRVRDLPTLETLMDDIRAVMDDAGSERAVLWSGLAGTATTVLFAATYPERTAGLVSLDPWVAGTRSSEYPWAPTEEEWRRRLAEIRDGWGRRDYLERLAHEWAPEAAGDDGFREWFVWHMRRSLSPGAALAFYRIAMESDVTDVLPAVRVPTLVLSRPDTPGPARFMAERVPNAELVELTGLRGIFTWINDAVHERTMRETHAFVSRLTRPTEPHRVLATILFTDIVGSTARSAELGDAAWRKLLDRHHALVRRELTRHHGDELDTAGDGFFASFDGPGRAIACACAIRDEVRSLGLEIRAGLHKGECERVDGKLGGIAVSLGARVAAEAAPGEVLVTGTVRDLVAGSELEFEERGERELKGVPGTWRLFAVA